MDNIIEELEDETKFIIIDGKSVTIKAVIDRILNEDNDKKKRKIGEG